MRIGLDRDDDGFRDRDELDAGSDPADRTSTPPHLDPSAPVHGTVALQDAALP